MGFAIVRLRWSPDEFWRATPHEVAAACEMIELMNKEAKRGR